MAAGAAGLTASAGATAALAEEAAGASYDVVVVGFGGAGASAAIAAADLGAKVLVVEKAPEGWAGGNTRLSGQQVLCPSDLEAAVGYLVAIQDQFSCDEELIRATTQEMMANEQALTDLGAKVEYITYSEFPEVPGSETMTCCLVDRERSTGKAWAAYYEGVLARADSIDVWYDSPAKRLVLDAEGAVTGVVVEHEGGEVEIAAAKGVIMACGGFENNQDMIQCYLHLPYGYPKGTPYNTGDGILMAMQLGAGMVQTGHCHMMHDFDSGPMASVPFMAVNMDGNRFMNEDMPFTMINVQMRDQPKPGWFVQIYDGNYETTVPEMGFKATPADAVQKWMPEVEMDRSVASGNKVIEGLVDLYCADTLEELAEKIEVPADALIASVERYNELVDAGFDEDFGKNPKYLKKIEQAPFWGARKHIRVSALCAGMTVNENYQVITTEGEVIPHLWATGFGAGQLCGAPDWSMYQSGMSAGHCFTSGRYTAIHAVTGGLEPSKPVMWEDIADLVPEQ